MKFATIVNAEVTELVDARGRRKELAVVPCPEPRCAGQHSLIIAIRGLEPLHFNQLEALDLVHQLLDGPRNQRLRPSPFQSGRYFAVTQLPHGRVLVAYDLEGLCDLIIAGGPSENVAPRSSVLLTPEHRVKWANIIYRELAMETGDLAGRMGARA